MPNSSRRSILRLASAGTLLAALAAAASAQERGRGLLLLAHGAHAGAGAHGHAGHAMPEGDGGNPWNANVEAVARSVDRRLPTEVAFGMADPQTIEAAVRRLEARGAQEIAVVPLFVSSHSPIIGNSRYILRLQPALARTTRLRHLDQVSSSARFRFADAMDAHALVSEILLDRALAFAARPPQATVVLIAHGPNDEEENRAWLRDMQAHARFLRERGGFADVKVLTHRNDAPAPVKAEARAAFRREVGEAARRGEVVVVPLLLSAGGVEAEVESDLRGLNYRFAPPLMPHPNIARWVESQADAALAQR